MSDDAMLTLERVTKTYGAEQEIHALDKVDLAIKRGERVAVMGPSGSGKSTLLNVICGLDVPTSGRVLFEGVDLSSLSDDECTRWRREKVGMVFQTFNLLPTLTASENVSLVLRLQGLGKRESESRAREMLERVNLGHRVTHLPDEMSGGERQRASLARALVFGPPVLLADEPTGNLDSTSGEEVLRLLDRLHEELGTTIVLVTHNELAASHCERVVTLRDGRIVKDEKTAGTLGGENVGVE